MKKDEKFQFVNMVSSHMSKIGCSPAVAQFVAFQFALESNFGRSNMAKNKNNICGMKVPTHRPTFNVGTSGFALYSSVLDCLNDYCLWLSYNKFNLFELSHLDLFQAALQAKHYCPEEDYIERIINLQNQTKF